MLVLLAYLCPPLAVLLTAPLSQAVTNVGFTLLLYIPGVLHAREVVDRFRIQRRYDAMPLRCDHEGAGGSWTSRASGKARFDP